MRTSATRGGVVVAAAGVRRRRTADLLVSGYAGGRADALLGGLGRAERGRAGHVDGLLVRWVAQRTGEQAGREWTDGQVGGRADG